MFVSLGDHFEDPTPGSLVCESSFSRFVRSPRVRTVPGALAWCSCGSVLGFCDGGFGVRMFVSSQGFGVRMLVSILGFGVRMLVSMQGFGVRMPVSIGDFCVQYPRRRNSFFCWSCDSVLGFSISSNPKLVFEYPHRPGFGVRLAPFLASVSEDLVF